jgi:hypothetical protein
LRAVGALTTGSRWYRSCDCRIHHQQAGPRAKRVIQLEARIELTREAGGDRDRRRQEAEPGIHGPDQCRSVVWSNEGREPVQIAGKSGSLAMSQISLAGGTKSSPIRIGRLVNRGNPPERLEYEVDGKSYCIEVVDEAETCDSEESSPTRWVVQLIPRDKPQGPIVEGLTIVEGKKCRKVLTIRAGDFIVWHNPGSQWLIVESAPANPFPFRVAVEPGEDSTPIRFLRTDEESGVNEFQYRIRPRCRPSGLHGSTIPGPGISRSSRRPSTMPGVTWMRVSRHSVKPDGTGLRTIRS